MDEIEYYKTAAYVDCSMYRLKTLNYLRDNEFSTPTKIAKGINIRSNHVSKCLRELTSKKLIECVNPEQRKGRLYRLTPYGERLFDYLERIG